MINLADIRTEVKSLIKQKALSNVRIDRWANMTLESISRSMEAGFYEKTENFNLAAGVAEYNIGCSIRKIKSLVDNTNNVSLSEISQSDIDRFNPDLADTGSPIYYSLYGMSWVTAQPTVAAVVTVVSKSAADITQTVRIRGVVDGIDDDEQVTLNGLAAVSTTKSFSSIEIVSKSDITDGAIVVTSGATTIVTILADKLFMQYQPIRIYPVPTAVTSMRVRYIKLPRPLVNPEDVPDVPQEWSELVLTGTLIWAHENVYDFQIAAELRAKFEGRVLELSSRQSMLLNNTRTIKTPKIGGGKIIGRYPSNFPVR